MIAVNIISAQSNYYYANNQRQYWRDDSTSINIIVANMQQYDLIANNLRAIFSTSNDTLRYGNEDNNIIVISNSLRKIDLSQLLSNVSPNLTDISFVSYAKK